MAEGVRAALTAKLAKKSIGPTRQRAGPGDVARRVAGWREFCAGPTFLDRLVGVAAWSAASVWVVDPDIERWLAQCAPAVAELVRELCLLVYEVLPDAVTTVDADLIGFGVAPGYRGVRFTVAAYRDHVNLGIAHGVELPDPAGLMEGKGRVHRHVKIRSREQLSQPALRELMTLAAQRS